VAARRSRRSPPITLSTLTGATNGIVTSTSHVCPAPVIRPNQQGARPGLQEHFWALSTDLTLPRADIRNKLSLLRTGSLDASLPGTSSCTSKQGEALHRRLLQQWFSCPLNKLLDPRTTAEVSDALANHGLDERAERPSIPGVPLFNLHMVIAMVCTLSVCPSPD
jgi:hypothetical protein